jgi:uncharacterized integral membrane protein
MRAIKLILIFLLVVIAAVFGAHNGEYVKIDLFPFPVIFYVKSFILPLGACIFGIIVGGAYASARALYWRTKYNRLLRKNSHGNEP